MLSILGHWYEKRNHSFITDIAASIYLIKENKEKDIKCDNSAYYGVPQASTLCLLSACRDNIKG